MPPLLIQLIAEMSIDTGQVNHDEGNLSSRDRMRAGLHRMVHACLHRTGIKLSYECSYGYMPTVEGLRRIEQLRLGRQRMLVHTCETSQDLASTCNQWRDLHCNIDLSGLDRARTWISLSGLRDI